MSYRLPRICSKPESFKRRLEELKLDLLSRGYKPKIIDDAFKRVMKVERDEALKKVEVKRTTREVLCTTFHPGLPSVSSILKKYHSVLTVEDPQMQDIFPTPSLVCYKRHKNLKDMLIRAKVSTKRHAKRRIMGLKPCHMKGGCCIMCSFCPITKTHESYRTGER